MAGDVFDVYVVHIASRWGQGSGAGGQSECKSGSRYVLLPGPRPLTPGPHELDRPPQCREAAEPVERGPSFDERGLDVGYVGTVSAHGRLMRVGPDGLEQPLRDHQVELAVERLTPRMAPFGFEAHLE